MADSARAARKPDRNATTPKVIRWLVVAAVVGLAFAGASTWVHYRILHDPFYSSICDVNVTFSCTDAYTSRFGSVAGVPVALLGVLYFCFILGIIALCQRSSTARQNLPGYVFAISTIGLAGVLYFAYASFVVLKAVCLLCVGAYAAIVALFLLAGGSEKSPMTTLPGRAARDLGTLIRTPAALASAAVFVALAVFAVMRFPVTSVSASSAETSTSTTPSQAAQAPTQITPEIRRQLEEYLATQPRVPVVAAGGSGAAVVIVKFNDYQCPPCRMTFEQYKPVLARLQQEHPGKIAYITKDFPLDPECNQFQVGHDWACEAAVAVRLAKEKGRGDAMEDWLFTHQPTMNVARVKEGLSTVAGSTDFDARYPKMLELVKGDIQQGAQLGVRGTPTFFMNGIRLQILPAPLFQAAVEWELRRVAAK